MMSDAPHPLLPPSEGAPDNNLISTPALPDAQMPLPSPTVASPHRLEVESTGRAGGESGNGLYTREHNNEPSTTTTTTTSPTAAAIITASGAAETTPIPLPSTPHNTHDDAETSMTLEGEMTMAEHTLVEDTPEDEHATKPRTHGHAKGLSGSSFGSRPPVRGKGHGQQMSVESVRHGDPLRREEEEAGEETVLEEDIVDFREVKGSEEDDNGSGESAGQVLAVSGEKGSQPSRRPAHLKLDARGPSPTATPWEDMEPPLDNNLKAMAGYYSLGVSGPPKFRTLQNSGAGSRPLIPKSSYYFGPPGAETAYGTAPVGQIGVHHPREVLRIERDYTGGELIQFAPIYPLELEGRLTPTQFLESINSINEILISAHSLRHSLMDHMLAILSLQIAKLFVKTHFEKEMERLQELIEELNTGMYNPVGLNLLWPRDVAFLYLEIEYY